MDNKIDSDDSLFCNKGTGYSGGDGWAHQNGVDALDSQTAIGSAVSTFVQLMFALGIVDVFVVWQGSAIGSIVTRDRSQKRKLKQYRGSALTRAQMWFVQNAVPGATRGRRRGFVVRVGGGLIRG